MQWFNDMGIRRKIGFALSILLVVYVATFAITLQSRNQISAHTEAISERYLVQLTQLLEADRDLHQALLAEEAMIYAATPALLTEHRDNIEQARGRANKAIDLLDEADRESTRQRFTTALDAWASSSGKVVALARNSETEAALAQSASSRQQFDGVRTLIDQLTQQQEQAAAATRTLLLDEMASSSTIQILLAAIMLGSIVLIIALLPRAMQGPLQTMNQRLGAIASGDGDLRPRLQLQQADEVGQLAAQFDRFMDKLQHIVTNIKHGSADVSASAAAMTREALDNKTVIDKQHDAIRVVVAAVDEITSAIRDVAANTSHTAERAADADAISRHSQAILGQAIANVHNLSGELAAAATMITELKDQAANATSVLDVIRAIAEQTNLLALNAAIEAARAGEQGRGFAVVADEVRTLASRTQASTADIQQTLQGLQAGVNKAVDAIHHSTATTRAAVVSAEEAGQGIASISAGISEISQMAMQIAAAVEEQSQVINGINDNITRISHQAQAASDSADRSSAASQQLQTVSTNLSDNVNAFKV